MRNCPNCNFENPEESAFCSRCGAPMNGQPAYQPQYQPIPSPWDHTKDYDEQDIHENKLYAMSCYLLSVVGILISLFAAPDSAYVKFHIHQAMKLTILEMLVGLLSAILCFTVIVPIAGAVLELILVIVQLVAFADVCRNKAVEPWLARNMKFLN